MFALAWRSRGARECVLTFSNSPATCSPALRAHALSPPSGALRASQRTGRDPYARAAAVNTAECPAMAELLVYCGPRWFDQELPWAPAR